MVEQCATEPNIVLPQIQISQTLVVEELESHTLAEDRGVSYLISSRICRPESGSLGVSQQDNRIVFQAIKTKLLGFLFFIKSRGHILPAIRSQGTISQIDYCFFYKKI